MWAVIAFTTCIVHVLSFQHWPIGSALTLGGHKFDCTTPHGFLIQMVTIWLIFGIGQSMSRPWPKAPQETTPDN